MGREEEVLNVPRVYVDPQPTPNPNAMKFTVSAPVSPDGSQSYGSKEAAESSPLAKALFALDGVASVFMLGNFVTVNKAQEANWNDLAPSIAEVIEEQFSK